MPPDGRLPRHIRFAQSLALLSGAAIGIVAGAALLVPAGWGMSCNGICGYVPPVTQPDAGDGSATANAPSKTAEPDAGVPGGGPLAAPPLPASWMA